MPTSEWAFREIVMEIRQLWGDDKRWSDEASLAAYRRFRRFDEKDLREALDHLFEEGSQTAPSPSTFMAVVKRIRQDRVRTGENKVSCDRGHRNIGVIDPIRTALYESHVEGRVKPSGQRHGICAACRTEVRLSPDRLRTIGEIAESSDDELTTMMPMKP